MSILNSRANAADALGIHFSQLSFAYPGLKSSDPPQTLLLPFDADFAPGGVYAVMGRSGCGKSTFLKAIAGLLPVWAGDIRFYQLAADASKQMLMPCALAKGSIAYLAQQDGLLPWLSVADNIALYAHLHGEKTKEVLARVAAVAEAVGLAKHLQKKPYALSGGQRQRVALARTLMQDARLILMDEPFSALDAITREEIYQLFATLFVGKTVVMVTHDAREAVRFADQVFLMQASTLSQALTIPLSKPRAASSSAQIPYETQLIAAL